MAGWIRIQNSNLEGPLDRTKPIQTIEFETWQIPIVAGISTHAAREKRMGRGSVTWFALPT
jgi:hypothetical protein